VHAERAQNFVTYVQYRYRKFLAHPFYVSTYFSGNILLMNFLLSLCKDFSLIVQKSFNAAGFRGPVHIDSALCGQAG
jgi:hypothetical protein